ncbi:Bromodomain and WD repeat-containing protein 3 [Podila epigama]|nr:Bromodomain and WD repeat-containing protein 3 [Podila epigama]
MHKSHQSYLGSDRYCLLAQPHFYENLTKLKRCEGIGKTLVVGMHSEIYLLQSDLLPRRERYVRAKEVRGTALHHPTLPSFVPSMFEELVIMNGHRFPTFCLLFDKTNNRVITGSDDYLVKIWSADSGYLLFTLRGHAAVVTYMDLSPDNTMLATASNDGIVRVWDLKTSAPIAVLPTGTQSRARKHITTVSFSPSPVPHNRYLIATSLDGHTWVWRYDRLTKKFQAKPTMLDCKTVGFGSSELKCATWNSTGSQFAVAGLDLFIRVFSTIHGCQDVNKVRKRRKSQDSKNKISGTDSVLTNMADGSTSAAQTADPSQKTQDWGDPVLIAQLEGHRGVVTSLSYSRSGNRLLSGSVDGFLRIWKYDQESKMWASTAIDLRDEHVQAEATTTAARSMIPSPTTAAVSSNPFTEPENNTDSDMNASSSQPQGAEPTMAISTSSTDATSAITTTTTETASATASTATGTATATAETTATAGTPATTETPRPGRSTAEDSRIIPTMAIWSLDDSTVILTTSLGEVKIFDSVTGQWIHTLREHVRGSSIYVVDVHPHDKRILMTAGYDGQIILWDIEKGIKIKSWLYPEYEFLDGRFSPDGMSFAVTDQEGKCILFGAGKNPNNYQDARTFVEQTFWSDYAPVRYDADHNVVDDATQIAPHLMERTPILDNNGRDYAKQRGPQYGLDLPATLPQGVLEKEEALKLEILEKELENLSDQTLAVLQPTDKRKLYKRRREFILEDEDDEDDDPMTVEVPIVPLPNDSSGEEYAGGAVSASSSSDTEEDESDLAPEDNGGSPKPFVVNDDDDDEDYYGAALRRTRASSSGGTPRKSRVSTSERKRRTGGRARKRMRIHSDDEDDDDLLAELGYSDDESDTYSARSRTPTRKGKKAIDSLPSGSKSQRSARPKSFANDDYPSDEALELENSEPEAEEDDEGVFSGSSAGGSFSGTSKNQGLASSSSSSTQPHSANQKKKQWRGNGRKKGKAVIRDEGALEIQRWLPSDWIKMNEPRKTPYHPQIGDNVAYFRQGHSYYLNETPLRSKLNMKAVPYIRDPALPWVTFGRVSRITYNVGPPTWCTITLEEQILSSAWGYPPNPQFTPSRRRFEIEFHDLGDVPDFIVLYSVFQEGANAQYQAGEQIWASFEGSSYSGTISNQVVEDPEFEDSLWMAFEVSWPAGNEITNLSPWEMQRDENEDLVEREVIPKEENERIDRVIRHLIEMEEFQIFKGSVDFEAYPDYCKTVAYPICLDSIQERLYNGYYRRSRAVQYDIELLEENALTYNDPRSDIALFAKQLSRVYKTAVANPHRPLPPQIRIRKTRRDEDDEDEFDGSGIDEQVDVDSEPELDLVDEDDGLEDDDDPNDFLDDESSNDEEPSRSRSKRRSSGRSNGRSSRVAKRSTVASVTNGSRRQKKNGKQASSNAGRSSRHKRKSNSDDDDFQDQDFLDAEDEDGVGDDDVELNVDQVDDDDDIDDRGYGQNGGRSKRAKRSGRRQNGDGGRTSRSRGRRARSSDDDFDDRIEMQDEDKEMVRHSQSSLSSPPPRIKRRRAKIADSDDDYA